MPLETAEQKWKERQKVKINSDLIDAQQQLLEFKKGQLHVDGSVYSAKVKELSCANVLEMDSSTLRKVLVFKLFEGEDFSKNGSKFTAYAAKAHTISQVLDGYRQLNI